MGEITESTRRHYSGLSADKASIPAGGKGVGDRFFATDTKIDYFWDGVAWIIIPPDVIVTGMIQNLNVTTGKAEIGFGRYVPRDTNALDFTIGTPFVLDGNWYVDQLDTTGIVPAGAVAVVFSILMRATAANIEGTIRRSVASGKNKATVVTQVANIILPDVHAIIPCDANRLFDCRFFANINLLEVTITGWFI